MYSFQGTLASKSINECVQGKLRHFMFHFHRYWQDIGEICYRKVCPQLVLLHLWMSLPTLKLFDTQWHHYSILQIPVCGIPVNLYHGELDNCYLCIGTLLHFTDFHVRMRSPWHWCWHAKCVCIAVTFTSYMPHVFMRI